MKLSAILTICLLSTVTAAQPSRPTVADLGWMSGCWVMKNDNSTSFISERWTKPFGKMLGTNRDVRNGSVGFYEYLRIEEREGEIYYVAKPARSTQETSFKLTALEGKSATFENPDHDFPKRIVYSLSPDRVLTARVQGDEREFSLVFRKVSCDE